MVRANDQRKKRKQYRKKRAKTTVAHHDANCPVCSATPAQVRRAIGKSLDANKSDLSPHARQRLVNQMGMMLADVIDELHSGKDT